MDIPKPSSTVDLSSLTPNFSDNFHRYLDFDWQYARNQIRGYGFGINMGYEVTYRLVEEGYKDQLALIFLGKKGQRETYTYGQMQEQSDRFTNVLSGLGIEKGQLLYSLSDRVPILCTAILGCLKARVVFSPLFSAFGPEPIRSRMEIGKARVLLTSAKYYQKKVAAGRHELSHLDYVLLHDCHGDCPDGCIDIDVATTQQNREYKICQISTQATALLDFTNGTTGQPKDVYWCTADLGWVTGISYRVISPLCNRTTLIINHGEFDPSSWYNIIEQKKVNVWYTAPTVIRMLMKAVDGMNVVDVEAAAKEYCNAIRCGSGPCFLECNTYRFRGHSMFNTQLYPAPEEVKEWQLKGPIVELQNWLQNNHELSESELMQLEADVAQEINAAVAFAEESEFEAQTDLLYLRR